MSSVTIGMTTKGINSTSRIMSGGVSLDCRLKEPCSLHDPVFIVKGLSKSYNNYNFATWRGRYYYVSDIVFLTNDIQEVHCHLDPLATFKGAIDDTNALVKYGDSAHWNKEVDDIRFFPEVEDDTFSNSATCGIAWNLSVGTVVVRVMDCATSHPGIKTYAMTLSNFGDMLCDLSGSTIDSVISGEIGSISELTSSVGQDLAAFFSSIGGTGSWRDNLLSAIYIPIGYSAADGYAGFGTPVTEIKVGMYPVQVNARLINANVIKSTQVNLPWNWVGEAMNLPFLRNERWCTAQIITPTGYSQLPIPLMRDDFEIDVRFCINMSTGEWSMRLMEDGKSETLGTFSGNCGADLMSMVGSGANAFAAAGNMISNLGGKAIGMMLAQSTPVATTTVTDNSISTASQYAGPLGVGSESTRVGNGSTSVTQHYANPSGIFNSLPDSGVYAQSMSGSMAGGMTSFGVLGAIAGTMQVCILSLKTWKFNDVDNYEAYCDEYGYPCNAYLKLSSVSGYCQCAGAFVRDIPGATLSDISTINSYLNAGIVLEA